MRDQLAVAEYHALRHTIASRGTIRPVLLVVGVTAWALTLLTVLAVVPQPLIALLPLLVLVATFEAVRSLHAGVERIGRFLEVYYEPPSAGPDPAGRDLPSALPAWERTTMKLAPRLPGASGHPLFLPIFIAATLVNLLGVWLPRPIVAEIVVLGVAHAVFVGWMLAADRKARRQREADRARYQELRSGADRVQ